MKSNKWQRSIFDPNLLELPIVIIGAGGLGSSVFLDLLHRGFVNVTIIDDDVVEASNLNRLTVLTAKDVGEPKVRALERYQREKFPKVDGCYRQERIPTVEAEKVFRTSEVSVCCVDNLEARFAAQVFARRHQTCHFDLGSGFHLGVDGLIEKVSGQVHFSQASFPCINCCGFTLKTRPAKYLVAEDGIGPSALYLNNAVTALFSSLFSDLLAGKAMPSRAEIDLSGLSIESACFEGQSFCPICEPDTVRFLQSQAVVTNDLMHRDNIELCRGEDTYFPYLYYDITGTVSYGEGSVKALIPRYYGLGRPITHFVSVGPIVDAEGAVPFCEAVGGDDDAEYIALAHNFRPEGRVFVTRVPHAATAYYDLSQQTLRQAVDRLDTFVANGRRRLEMELAALGGEWRELPARDLWRGARLCFALRRTEEARAACLVGNERFAENVVFQRMLRRIEARLGVADG